MNLQDLNKLSSSFKSEYFNMVKEKSEMADRKVRKSINDINFKKDRTMSIMFKIEAPVLSWKQGLKRLDTVIEKQKGKDNDYHLNRIFCGLADKSINPYSTKTKDVKKTKNKK